MCTMPRAKLPTSLAAATAIACAPALATAASVRLHVQAPFDLTSQKLDLEQLEYQNLSPVFSRWFEVPYDTLEPLLAGMLEDVVGRQLHFYVKCWGLGIDELCPDTDITVNLHSSFKFTQKGQPVVTSIGAPKDNTFRIKLDAQARLGLDAAIHHETGIWYSGSETVDIHALIGAHAQVDIKLWPTVSASNLKVELTHDGGNIGIDGLSEQIIVASTVVGGAVLGPVGAALGAIFGSIGAAAAEDAIKDAINAAITDQLSAANVQLRDLIQAQIDPAIAQIVDYQNKTLNTKIPGLGLTLSQALAVGPASLDVRTRAVGSDVNAVVTTRFDPTPKGKSLQGAIRFPKTMCRYVKGGNKTVGFFSIPVAVDPINADLPGKSCSDIITGMSLARSTYLGESPEKLLKSGDPANDLPSWQATGNVSTSGAPADKGDYYECPYAVGNLPAAAILDLGSVKGTELANRLDTFGFRARFLFASLIGPALLFDAEGKPENPAALVFGGKGPAVVGDCPSSYSAGTGFQKDKLADLKDKFDPDKCPVCGLLDVFNHRDMFTNPGARLELVGVANRTSIAHRVDAARAALAAKGKLEGLGRVQAALDAGLLTRSWAAVDKARTRGGKLRLKNITLKQVGPALSRQTALKVLDGGAMVPLRNTRLLDSALPKTDVEITVKGKNAK